MLQGCTEGEGEGEEEHKHGKLTRSMEACTERSGRTQGGGGGARSRRPKRAEGGGGASEGGRGRLARAEEQAAKGGRRLAWADGGAGIWQPDGVILFLALVLRRMRRFGGGGRRSS